MKTKAKHFIVQDLQMPSCFTITAICGLLIVADTVRLVAAILGGRVVVERASYQVSGQCTEHLEAPRRISVAVSQPLIHTEETEFVRHD
jgi:hypothetical protein